MANENQKHSETMQRVEASPSQPARKGMVSGSELLPLFTPFTLMRRLIDDIDRLAQAGGAGAEDAGLAPWPADPATLAWVPALEIFERDGQLVIRTELPGIKKEQLRIDAEPGRLILSGERSQDVEQRGTNFFRSERRYGSFRRVVLLPEGADAEQARATFNDGVLEITIPAPQIKTSHQIQIQGGPGATNTKPESNTGQSATAPAA
ncbi:MAG TPA: Hsp20/alpha crystallin family protein [Polyangiaceae bacterium]|nr:Hsp20/alpha crystallin family protein [Polyangiaceae bacterium]